MSPEALHAFQCTHLDHLARPLAPTGIADPATEWALDLETLCPERQAIVQRAQEHLGLVEDPPRSNSDPAGFIRRWLLVCGAQPGDPWCAAYASHCIGTVHIGSAILLGRHFPATSQPLAGDVLWFPHDAVRGHCGIVIGVSATEIMSIEGNSDNEVRCVRRARATVRFGRTVEDVSGTSPGVVPTVPFANGGTR